MKTALGVVNGTGRKLFDIPGQRRQRLEFRGEVHRLGSVFTFLTSIVQRLDADAIMRQHQSIAL